MLGARAADDLDSRAVKAGNPSPLKQEQARRGLLRVLGLAFGVAAVIGGVVGQGILRTPGIAARGVPEPTLYMLLWAGIALISLIDAMSSAELGGAAPTAGGPYAYGRRAFGRFGGFMTGWVDGVTIVLSISFFAVVVAEYMQRLGLFAAAPTGIAAAGFMVCCVLFNLSGTRIVGSGQVAFNALKGAMLLVFAAACFLFAGDRPAIAEPSPPPSNLTWLGAALAARAVMGTYAGWNTPLYFLEEVRAPGCTVVRSLFGGIALVGVVYVAFNAALLHILPMQAIAASTLPAAEAAHVIAGPSGALFVTIYALFSVMVITSLYVAFQARMLFAMARDDLAPRALQSVSANGTPAVAVIVIGAVAAMLASTGVYERLLAIYAPVGVLINMIMNVAVIRLRLKEPSLPRPYRMPLFPLPAIFAFAVNGLLMAAFILEDPQNSLWSFAALLPAAPAYLAFVHGRRRGAGNAKATR